MLGRRNHGRGPISFRCRKPAQQCRKFYPSSLLWPELRLSKPWGHRRNDPGQCGFEAIAPAAVRLWVMSDRGEKIRAARAFSVRGVMSRA
ncbi:hypothetical protein BaRGS_00002961 [Batillaria attramentaria]|uniref:Uncharacterized protein n=1 Tax=Batillaria attramentaria TaxID=370345 RepID=A0ABD0M1T3_9CAEN